MKFIDKLKLTCQRIFVMCYFDTVTHRYSVCLVAFLDIYSNEKTDVSDQGPVYKTIAKGLPV